MSSNLDIQPLKIYHTRNKLVICNVELWTNSTLHILDHQVSVYCGHVSFNFQMMRGCCLSYVLWFVFRCPNPLKEETCKIVLTRHDLSQIALFLQICLGICFRSWPSSWSSFRRDVPQQNSSKGHGHMRVFIG